MFLRAKVMGHQSDVIWDHKLAFQIRKDFNEINQSSSS